MGWAKMLYAADVWCTSPLERSNTKSRTSAFITKMERVQRQVALRITGALRTTPSDLLLPHAGLIPLQLQIRKICQNSALRIATLPAHHPLFRTANKAAKKVQYRFKIEAHPICPHCHVEPESVTHFLKYCPAHSDARKELLKAIGRLTNLDTSTLSNPKFHRSILKFLHSSKRFQDTHGNLNPPAIPTQNQRNAIHETS